MRQYNDYSLLSHNTFGMDVRCSHFIEFDSADDLRDLLSSPLFASYGGRFLVIGGGSNLLFLGDWDGLILHSAIQGVEVVGETDDEVLVRVGSGIVWDDFVALSVERGWHGAENLSAIPGEVGAAAVQNIGAYGAEAAQLVYSVEAFDTDGHLHTFTNEECAYGYRDSFFKNEGRGQSIITNVTFRLHKQGAPNLSYGRLAEMLTENATPADVRAAVCSLRAGKLPDPAVLGNAGSFFKNPVIPLDHYNHLRDVWASIPCWPVDDEHVKVPAAWLIEQCGWKGRSLGRAAVHQNQPLVLVNLGGATGQEVAALATRIAADVSRTFDITISPEVNYIL